MFGATPSGGNRVGVRERAGHCTRCWTPFGDNATAYMIWLRTAAEIFQNGFATHRDKYAPVCDACVTPKEAGGSHEARNL